MAVLTLSRHITSLKPQVEQRLWKWLIPEPNSGCWLWLGAINHDGYGRLRIDGHSWFVHRLAYEILVGPIPKGLELDHKCRVRCCANPGHLEPVTHHENIMRGEGEAARHARKTHCKHGHRFTPENTYVDPKGYRICRQCRRRIDAARNDERAAYKRARRLAKLAARGQIDSRGTP